MSTSLPLVPPEIKMKNEFDQISQDWLNTVWFDPKLDPRFDPKFKHCVNEQIKQQIKKLLEFILEGKINQEKSTYGLSLSQKYYGEDHPFGFIYSIDHFPIGLMPFLPMFLYQLARREVFDSFIILFLNAVESLDSTFQLIERSLKKDIFRKIFEIQEDEFFNVCDTCLLITAIKLEDIVFFKYILQRSKKDLCDASWPGGVFGHLYSSSYMLDNRSPYALDYAIYLYVNTDLHSEDRQGIAQILLEMGCNPNIHRFSILVCASSAGYKPAAIYQLLKFGANILNLNIEMWHSGQKLYKELKTSSFAYTLKQFMTWDHVSKERCLRIMEILCNEGALLVLPEYRTKQFDDNCQERDLRYNFNTKLFTEDIMDSAFSFDPVLPSSTRCSGFTSMIFSPLVSMTSVLKNMEVNDITVGKLSKSEIALRFVRNNKPAWLFTIANLKLLLNRCFTHRHEFDEEQRERFERMADVVSKAGPTILVPGVKEAFLEFDEKVMLEFKAIKECVRDKLSLDTASVTMQYLYVFRSGVPTTYCPEYLRRRINSEHAVHSLSPVSKACKSQL